MENIYDLLCGVGLRQLDGMDGANNRLMESLRDIAKKLGDNIQILSAYLHELSSICYSMSVQTIVEQCDEDMGRDLRRIIDHFLNEGNNAIDHPMSSIVLRHIQEHPCPASIPERDFYIAIVAPHYARYACARFMDACRKNIDQQRHEAHCGDMEAELLKHIEANALVTMRNCFFERYIVIPTTTVYLQALNDEVISCLMYQNEETGVYMIDHLLRYLMET